MEAATLVQHYLDRVNSEKGKDSGGLFFLPFPIEFWGLPVPFPSFFKLFNLYYMNRSQLERQATRLIKAAKNKRKRSSIPSAWAMGNRGKLVAKDNRAEAAVEAALIAAGVLFTRESPIRCNGNEYFMDFAAETDRGIVCIEIDGRPHLSAEGQAKDRKRERDILSEGEAIAIVRMSWPVALKCDHSIRDTVKWASCVPGSVILLY